jgi:hypothetical protein
MPYTEIGAFTMRVELDDGPERETGDPTPRGTQVLEISTSASSDIPFFSVVDSAQAHGSRRWFYNWPNRSRALNSLP